MIRVTCLTGSSTAYVHAMLFTHVDIVTQTSADWPSARDEVDAGQRTRDDAAVR